MSALRLWTDDEDEALAQAIKRTRGSISALAAKLAPTMGRTAGAIESRAKTIAARGLAPVRSDNPPAPVPVLVDPPPPAPWGDRDAHRRLSASVIARVFPWAAAS